MLKKILASILFLTFLSVSTYAAELNIVSVSSTWPNLVKILLDTPVVSDSDILTWDTKVYKDIKVDNIQKDLELWTKISINLAEPLMPNTSYSFLSVYGLEGNMDFTLWEEIDGVEIQNPDSIENVASIFIFNSNNIEVNFKEPVISDDIDVKVLKDLSIWDTSLNLENKTELNLSVQDSLEENSNYILMMFSLNTLEGTELSFLNGIYDFSTETFIEEVIEEQIMTEDTSTGDLDTEIMPEVSEDTWENLNWEVEDLALNAAQTPDTWAETWILIALTFIMSSIIFVRRKFVK